MKKIGLCLVGLILVVSFAGIAVTSSDSSYDPMADVNRDGLVDANDLNRIGQAYGSTSLVHQPGKTVISVWNETARIENARVAVFSGGQMPNHVGYTNSLGIVNFTFSPNTDFTAVAWNRAKYNYANFTTDSYGEASVFIPLNNGMKHFPPCWVVTTFINKTSGELLSGTYYTDVYNITGFENHGMGSEVVWTSYAENAFSTSDSNVGISAVTLNYVSGHDKRFFDSKQKWGFVVYNSGWSNVGNAICMPDENGNANVVIYV